eukprot:gene1018-9923_t
MYYNNEDISSSDSENENTTTTNKKTVLKRKETETPQETSKAVLLVIRHLPIGFFEEQIKEFFSQFCEVIQVRVVRSIKTGKSRGVAFAQVADMETAKVICEEMDYYYLGRKTLRVEISKLEPEQVFLSYYKNMMAIRNSKSNKKEQNAKMEIKMAAQKYNQ